MTLAMHTLPRDLCALYDAGQYKEALRCAEAHLLPALGNHPEDPSLAEDALLVANLYRELGRYGEAEPFYLRTLSGLAAAGKERADYARGLAELATLYTRLGRDAQATELLATATSIHRAAESKDPVAQMRSLKQWAGLLDNLGQRREAVACLREARAGLDAAQAPDGAYADLLLEEAWVLCRVEGCVAAVDRARRGLRLHSAASGPGLMEAKTVLGTLLVSLSNFDEAAAHLDEVLRWQRETVGPTHPRLALPLQWLALARSGQGRTREAEELARRSLELTQSQLGERHPTMAECQRTLAKMVQTSRPAEAEAYLEAALDVARERFGVDHPCHAELLLDLAELRDVSGRFRDAVELTRTALDCLDRYPDDVRYERAGASLWLSRMAFEAGDDDDARTLARKAAALATDLTDSLLTIPAWVHSARLALGHGDSAGARTFLDQAEQALTVLQSNHPLHADVAMARADLERFEGEPEEALARAAALVRRAKGTTWLANALAFLAEQQHQLGRFEDSEVTYERALEIQRERGPEDPALAPTLRGLARLHLSRGNFQAAEIRFRKAWEIRRHALGDHHRDTAESLTDLAWMAEEAGDLPAAQALYVQATEIHRASLGEHHSETLAGLQRLATVRWNLGDSVAAAEMLEKALESLKKGHPQRELLQHSLALVCHTRGDITRALDLLGQVRAAYERDVGEWHDELTPVLGDLARVHVGLGDHIEARSLLERILAIHERSAYRHPLQQTHDLAVLATSYCALGNLEQADALAGKALRLVRSNLPNGDPGLVQPLTHVAAICRARRCFGQTQELLEEVESIIRRCGGERHPAMVGLLLEQARLELARGRPGQATHLFTTAADLAQKAHGEDHPEHANIRHILGLHLQAQGNPAGAEKQLRRHLEISRRTLGPDHPEVALAHLGLAASFRHRGDLETAHEECRRALNLIRTSGQSLDALHANALHELALVCRLQGKLDEAEKIFQDALAIDREWADEEGGAHLESLRELALVEAAQGRETQALERLGQVLAGQERLLTAFGCMPAGPARDQLLATAPQLVEQLLTLALGTPTAAEQVIEVALRWNALPVSDFVLGGRGELRESHPAQATRIDHYFDLNLQIAGRLINGPGPVALPLHRHLLGRWSKEGQRLEEELSGVLPALARMRAWREVTLAEVRGALPHGATLVELIRFRPCDFEEVCTGRPGLLPARYAAFVLDQEKVTLVDAGPAARLEGRGGAATLRAAVAPILADRGHVVVGHGGLRQSVWVELAPKVVGLSSGRELASPLLAAPPARGWLRRMRDWLGI